MRKNLFIVLAVLTGLVISMTACILGEDIDTLERAALIQNGLKTISIAAINGVAAPATGEIPVREITGNTQYAGTVTWSPEVKGTFANNIRYTATITLALKTGYTFRMVKANFFTVEGADSVTNSANSGVITAVFPPSIPVYTINEASIEGVTVPVQGGIPVTKITETAQYTGTVTWSPAVSGTFVFNTQYTATITLTAKRGYTLKGVKANFFTVAGANSVTNSANSGVITAAFPRAALVEMIQIPGGSFQMGGNSNSNEQPVHTVTLSGFYMGKYEVTQEQWTTVMGSNPSSFTSSPATGEVQNKRPVEYVSWYDTLVFCNKLSMREGLSPAYRISGSTDPANWGTVPTSSNSTWNAVLIVADSTGYRLPTEAQWEYAARGGNGSPGNYTYSGSNTVGEVAWYESNSGSKTHEVGKKSPNGLGLYDMSGNVWEWCWDWYGSYSSGAQTDPMGVSSGSGRVRRGGSWGDSAEDIRSTYRGSYGPYGRINSFGFRLVRP